MIADLGDRLLAHRKTIQRLQWVIVFVYFTLIFVPIALPLPGRLDHVWNNVTLFAQFVFWGIWWPFVLVSMVLVGRFWCGVMCPEGMLSELASRHGRGRAIPRWMRWKGWPFTAFALTTIYGQMISVYQYPGPVLLVLGGSTLAAIAIGLVYGHDNRVWCRFLCPVNGVFRLLSKLAPLHFAVDRNAWEDFGKVGGRQARVHCAPLVPIKTMRGNSLCHMCANCSGYRGAVRLALRSPSHEIVHVAGETPDAWETALIIFGLMGIAVGAFLWTVNPAFVVIKQALAEFLVNQGFVWPLEESPPWWLLTHYPDANDVFSVLDGIVLIFYIAATALMNGAVILVGLSGTVLACGGWSRNRFHHFAQALIPIAGSGVFLGLSALTVTLLRHDGFQLGWINGFRAILLAASGLWTMKLGWSIAGIYTRNQFAQIAATACFLPALVVGIGSWVMMFWVW